MGSNLELEIIFGNYTQEQLDRQYDQTTLVPDVHAHSAQWLERSARARANWSLATETAYGQHPDENLDLTRPAGTKRDATFILFHGGAWRALTRQHFSFTADGLLAAGIAAVVPDFSLVPQVSLQVQVQQAQSAFAWVWRNADQLRINRDRLFVAGHSSGGHLAALLATTDWTQWGLPANAVKGALSASGIYDLEPVRLSARNRYLDLTPRAASAASPVHALKRTPSKCRLVVAWAHGELDEFQRQGRQFSAEATRCGWPCVALELPEHDHFTIVDELASPSGKLLAEMIALVDD